MIRVSVSRDPADRTSRGAVVVAVKDDSGTRATLITNRRGASALMAVLLAATAPDAEDFDSEFSLKGSIE